MKYITKFSLATPTKSEQKPQRGTRRLSLDDTIDTMMYGYTTVGETITSMYEQIQQWAIEHMATQEHNYPTIIIDSLDISDPNPAITESYTDTIERIRRNTR